MWISKRPRFFININNKKKVYATALMKHEYKLLVNSNLMVFLCSYSNSICLPFPNMSSCSGILYSNPSNSKIYLNKNETITRHRKTTTTTRAHPHTPSVCYDEHISISVRQFKSHQWNFDSIIIFNWNFISIFLNRLFNRIILMPS